MSWASSMHPTISGPRWRQPPRVWGVELDIAAVEVAAGGGAFHHGWAWHGSGPNRSGRHRRSLVLHCASSEARFNRGRLR